MYHVSAYFIASAGGLTNQDIPAVSDNFASIFNNHLVFQQDWWLNWAMAAGVNLTNARLSTPYLQALNQPSIQPVDTAVTPSSLPAIAHFESSGIRLRAIDETVMQMTDTAGAGNLHGLIGLVDGGPMNVPSGRVTILRGTAAAAPLANVWGTGAITFDTTLPAGRYAIIGADVVGGNMFGFRFQFPQQGPRPGGVPRTSVANKPDPMFLTPNFGNWGEFESTAPPLLEVIGNTAPTTQTVFIKVVQVRDGR